MFSTFKADDKSGGLAPPIVSPKLRHLEQSGLANPATSHRKTPPTKQPGSTQTSRTFGRSKEKSKKGCLTCKFRKKKCDEVKPICRDCLRFGKECVWADYDTMSSDEIEQLRLRVQQQESHKKMRKRRKMGETSESNDGIISETPISTELTDSNMGRIISKDLVDTTSDSSLSYIHALKSAYLVSNSSSQQGPNSTVTPPQGTISGLANPDLAPPQGLEPPKDHENSIANVGLRDVPVLADSLSPFGMPMALQGHLHRQDLPKLFLNNHLSTSPPPLDLEFYSEPSEVNAGSQTALLNFFKELTQYNNLKHSAKISELDYDEGEIQGEVADKMFVNSPNMDQLADIKLSPNFNIPEFLEQVSHDSPAHLNHLASSFNAAFATSPQPPLSVLPNLDQSGIYLYNYYVDTLSRKVCIAPHSQDESNSYQKVFLPLAQRDKGVLYGILAWAGFHLGGAWLAEGSKYAEMAVKHLTHGVDFNSTSLVKHDRRTILNKLASILILCGAEICRGDIKYWSVYLNWGWRLLKDNGGILSFDNNKEEHWLISNFAYHDLLASSTSQRGTYFPVDTYQQIFSDPEGVSKGNLNPLLGVCKNLFKVIGEINLLAYESKRSLDQYYSRGSPINTSGIPDHNHNLLSPENIPTFLLQIDDMDSNMSEHGKTSKLLLSIIEKVKELENVIENSKPDSDDLVGLSDADLELQLTTFEAFQLSCKLYLRQSIMKCNPSSLESQVLVNDLVKCIDILIESPMQATLVFPIFIAGIHMVTDDDKALMNLRIQKMVEMYGPWNVVRVKYLIERVWERNHNGDSVVDWHSILVELGWDINFA